MVAATASCLLGGTLILVSSPPRYLATARVTMNYIKRDPITGSVVPSKMVDEYVGTQIRMVRDVQVGIPAAQSLGWMDDPRLLEAFVQVNPGGDAQAFQEWVGRRIASSTSAWPVEDSNILEIGFVADDPEAALVVVEAVRQGYITATLAARRASAESTASSLAETAARARIQLAELEAKRALYERETGIILPRGIDVDSRRMSSLAGPGREPRIRAPGAGGGATTQLAALEQRMAEAQRVYGPNHPLTQRLTLERNNLAQRAAIEQDAPGYITRERARLAAARASLLEAQKSKVLSQRDKVLQLRLYDDQVRQKANELRVLMDKVQSLRSLSNIEESGITPVSTPKVERKPVYPSPPLILGGTGGLGLLFGCLLAFLCEVQSRRVRCAEDVQRAARTQVLGVVPQSLPIGRKGGRALKLLRPGRRRKTFAAAA